LTKKDQKKAIEFAEMLFGKPKTKKEQKELLEWAKVVDTELDNW